LIDALVTSGADYHFRLYTRATPPANFFPPGDGYDIRAIPLPRLWTHLRLSYEILTHPPDALFVPSHVLPPVHPRNSLVTVHDLGYKYFPHAHPSLARLYLDWTTRWNVRAARAVIADSYATRDDIIRFYGTPPGKIRVIYPSYNRELFAGARDQDQIQRVRERFGLHLPYIVSVGTVQPRKNHQRLVEAFAGVPADHILVIVGKKGFQFERLADSVRALHLTGRVVFADYVLASDLPALYAGAQLAVLPSLYEGFGFPALEAQACGTPLICSNASSLPEVGGNGALYFDPQDVGQLRAAMLQALTDNALRRALVAQGTENLKRFSWERAARELLESLAG
jgi:glycosyltransferase involved in cell wall biosynthesis